MRPALASSPHAAQPPRAAQASQAAPPSAGSGHLMHIDLDDLNRADAIRSVYVYEAPVRLWHWVNALAITVLAITGFLIASPLPSPSGEASQHFMMGYVRFVHFTAGYALAIGLLGRTYWAVMGNYYAKEMFWVPIFQLGYWQDVWQVVKWYSFASPRPGQYIGHNPLARMAMFAGYLMPAVMMVFTGFALYGEGLGMGSWADAVFGWVIPLYGQSQDVHTWHHLGMWVIICFVILHIYFAVRDEIVGRCSMVSTMLSGHRTFRD